MKFSHLITSLNIFQILEIRKFNKIRISTKKQIRSLLKVNKLATKIQKSNFILKESNLKLVPHQQIKLIQQPIIDKILMKLVSMIPYKFLFLNSKIKVNNKYKKCQIDSLIVKQFMKKIFHCQMKTQTIKIILNQIKKYKIFIFNQQTQLRTEQLQHKFIAFYLETDFAKKGVIMMDNAYFQDKKKKYLLKYAKI
ncbi:hypothetical protein TTHERM_000245059 (macronuclear) [Tetrahymena thermophila SB210]|uniref:Uncharacterized protein n=1 Tax=Tetrahymena thermophila (strain SB210) TaxID=312017 RepID=W7X3N6_TETTS|nr:hypothetical protein TTHERM_000245059 [Tetrahymena thermophila SB210]EWS72067.1 hypothetical protein TTHERM_000245059 [Tetrahymena thermophila SB210]|eukprot:XP_012655378.1 hypothetical protein TTHERM_000245059 [Tetrahymena thermophila SB210]